MNDPIVIRRPEAWSDLFGIALGLDSKNPALGDRFLEAAERTMEQAARAPGTGAPLNSRQVRLAGIRIRTVDGFPIYLVFYREVPDGIEVIHVMHGARNLAALFDAEDSS